MSYDPKPWHPISNAVDLKFLGKLLEELGELTAAVSRCVIQGQNACHPVTGKPNLEWLQEEIADVRANIQLVQERFFLPEYQIQERITEKRKILKKWHDMA